MVQKVVQWYEKWHFGAYSGTMVLIMGTDRVVLYWDSGTLIPRPCTHGNVFLRFCIVSSNQVVLDSLENSKQYKNASKRFSV